jgi:hypothetical protein
MSGPRLTHVIDQNWDAWRDGGEFAQIRLWCECKIECERGVMSRNDRGTACRVSTGRAEAANMTIRGTLRERHSTACEVA